METTTLNPQYVYVQATEPSDKTEGKLWYNTTNNALYSSNGTTYITMETDTSAIQKLILENGVQILINSAGATTTLNDWDDMFIDNFSDSGGYLNTVDTGTTTAFFNTDKYKNNIISNDAHNVTLNAHETGTTKQGFKILTKNTEILTKVTKHNSVTATKCYLYSGDYTSLLDTQSFIGNDATFNYSLTDDTSYCIVVDKEDATFTSYYVVEMNFPVVKTNINYIKSMYNGSENDHYGHSITSITTNTISNKIVQTNAETITANPLAHQVYSQNTTAGTGTTTYDISFDNGSTWVINQAINTKNTSVHNGTQLIIKLNLNGSGIGNTAEAENYAIMLFY